MKHILGCLLFISILLSACAPAAISMPVSTTSPTTTLRPEPTAMTEPTSTITATIIPTQLTLPLAPVNEFMKGVVFNGGQSGTYSTASSDWTLLHIVKPLGVNWIRLHSLCFQANYQSTQINCSGPSSSSDADLVHVTQMAHQLGLRVMFEFPLSLSNDPEHWAGDIGKSFTEEEWTAWFKSYTDNMLHYAQLAEENQVDAFGIGQEISATTYRDKQWRAMIASVRQVYYGPLIYSSDEESNWTAIKWWDAVDYIGIHPYNFHITSSRKSGLDEMKASWKPIVSRLEALSTKFNRPIVITEIGYPSQDGIGMDMNNYQKWWDVDLQESADLYQALIESLSGKAWFHGLFPYCIDSRSNSSNPKNTLASIYAKPAYDVIRKFYGAPPLTPTAPVPTPSADSKNTMIIYDDSLENGWTNYPPDGNSGLIDLAQTKIAKNGNAIKVTLNPYTELIFHHEPYIDFTLYQWIAFDLYVPPDAPKPLIVNLYLRDPQFISMPLYVELTHSQYVEGGGIIPGQWQHVLVPMSAFGAILPPVKSVVISLGPRGPATIYVDNVTLLRN